MARKVKDGPVYDIRSARARELGMAPILYRVIEEGSGEWMLVRSVPRGLIDSLPKRHFRPENLVTDVEGAIKEFFAAGGEP